METKHKLSKFLTPAFYFAAMVLMVFYAWNEQIIIHKSGSSPLYRNLMNSPAYIRRGFDPADILKIPEPVQAAGTAGASEWVLFESKVLRVIDAPLPDMPKRTFLSPWGIADEEFTIIIPIEIDRQAMDYLGDNQRSSGSANSVSTVLPGLYFTSIGENWEIYFNGTLVRAEMHLDENGQIMERRRWWDTYFPMDSSLIVPGTNILALRIVGDPSYLYTGLAHTPHYMDDYRFIEGRHRNILFLILCGLFGFTGVYYLIIFLSVRDKREIFNLFFSLFSIMLCVYTITRHSMINDLIPNSDITFRLRYSSLSLSIPFFGMFLETLVRRKITKVTFGYLIFCIYTEATSLFFAAPYSDDIGIIWHAFLFIYFSYLVFYNIFYFYFWDKKGPRKTGTNLDSNSSLVNIFIGTLIIYVCGIYEVLDAMFFYNSYRLFQYSTFAVQIGMTLTLSQRFSGMYKQLERSNVMLETAVRKRTLELEEQTAIAVQASRAKSEFLATMSHEIRTPLNAVIGLSEIELRGSLSDSSRENIRQIHQSGSSLLGVINDILDISKIEAGKLELFSNEYETAPFISDTVNLNRVRIGSEHIDFVLEISSDFPRKLRGDELRVKQVLNNLLSNAIKFTKEGIVTMCAAWTPIKKQEKEAALLRFSVKDTGRGIRHDDMGKLFSSYNQLDTRANRKVEGTGLGLAISKQIVEMMGGSISVESEYGKGSIFTVEIVQEIEDSGPIGEETAESLRNFLYTTGRRQGDFVRFQIPDGKALIVDDLPMNLLVARGLLAPYGIEVDTAESGQEAIEKVRLKLSSSPEDRYNLIFMDHLMPGMDGIEAAAAIRALEKEYEKIMPLESRVPMIALTANALRGMKEYYLEQGFEDYLSKPISPELLDEVITRWIPQHLLVPMKPQIAAGEKGDESNEVRSGSRMSIAVEMEAQRLDMLNHYRVSFDSARPLDYQAKFDSAYFERFTALIESLETSDLPASVREQAALLLKAGQNGDAQKVKGTLPAFYAALRKQREIEEQEKGQGQKTLAEILPRLKKAILAGEAGAAERIMGELGTESLGPSGRELYFLLYDLLLADDNEKAIGAISLWERIHASGG